MAFAALAFAWSISPANQAECAESRSVPNIVLILADDLGYGDLASYGAEDMQTPQVDDLVASGKKFTNFYANCPVCSPTRASLMTGCYPDLVGVPGVIRTHDHSSWGYFAPDAVTLPTLLKTAGYHTAIVGKWHLGLREENSPTRRGFDHFHGFLGDMMDDYYHHRRHGNDYMRLGEKQIDPEGHATDLFANWAVSYIEGRADQSNPFFLYLAFNAPHTPIQPPDDWLKKVKDREPSMTDKRAKLVALIEHMDHAIGRVTIALEETGQAENTLIVFTSDNGGQLNVGANNGLLRDGKQSMYEGGIRVPAVVVWPGKIEAGSTTEALAITMDLYPTLCEVAGADVDHQVDGRSIKGVLLDDPDQLPERELVWVRREGGHYQGQDYYALRRGDWKLVQNHPFSPLELYNLAEDPKEENNLASKDRKKFNDLATALRLHVQRAGEVPWQKRE